MEYSCRVLQRPQVFGGPIGHAGGEKPLLKVAASDGGRVARGNQAHGLEGKKASRPLRWNDNRIKNDWRFSQEEAGSLYLWEGERRGHDVL